MTIPVTGIAGVDSPRGSLRMLRAGETCWRIAPARRAAFIVDSAAYFAAAKAAMRKAKRSILILGWDFDPRVRLEPGDSKAGQPGEIGAFLERLVGERAELHVHILIWDMALAIAAPRGFIPQRARSRLDGDRIRYRLDGRHPTGACHHQKIVVVDDAIAFCGGIDFAGNRWDTPRHADRDSRRRTPSGHRYAPHHDVMMAVDDGAAAVLGDLARDRWHRATGDVLPGPTADLRSDPWPDGLKPDATGVCVGIARTEPAWNDWRERRENEALYLRSIAAARRWIYLESQYFASSAIGDALAARLAEADGPEIVVLCPLHSPSYFDRLAMDPVRDRLIGRLRAADRRRRFRAYAPVAPEGTPIVVHSKLAIIDDRLLRIGSANLNNRSMGFDTECDLAIEVAANESREDRTRQAVLGFLDRLLSEHVGAPNGRVAASLAQSGSLIESIETLDREFGRRLRPLEGSKPVGVGAAIANWHLLDPRGTADAWRPWKRCAEPS